VFPSNIPTVSVEAASTFGWKKYASHSIGVDTFGHSAPAKQVYEKFGLTPEKIADVAFQHLKHTPRPRL